MDPLLRGTLGGRHRPAAQVLPVAEEDEQLYVLGFRRQGLSRDVEGARQIAAGCRDDSRLERTEGAGEGCVIEGERTLQERGAGKGDEA